MAPQKIATIPHTEMSSTTVHHRIGKVYATRVGMLVISEQTVDIDVMRLIRIGKNSFSCFTLCVLPKKSDDAQSPNAVYWTSYYF